MSEELSNILQEAAVMVSQTAAPHEDTVKTVGKVSDELRSVFEEKGAEAAQTRFEVLKNARIEGAQARLEHAPNPHLS